MPAPRIRFLTLPVAAATLLAVALPTPASAIEMFTFFGDGSRIGLPSLEVPIEAYPGIPLRSDRIRARRAARRGVAPVAAAPAPGGITIRQMPPLAAPQPRIQPTARRAAQPAEIPMAPAPEDVLPGAVKPPLAE